MSDGACGSGVPVVEGSAEWLTTCCNEAERARTLLCSMLPACPVYLSCTLCVCKFICCSVLCCLPPPPVFLADPFQFTSLFAFLRGAWCTMKSLH